MALRKRKPSSKVTKAETRLAAMDTIDNEKNTTINYGGEDNQLTTCEMRAQAELCRMLVNEYNFILGEADKKSEAINLATLTSSKLLILENNCGHLAVTCEIDRVREEIAKFLDE